MLLKDKAAVVTGGGRGIGKAIVQHFLEEGAYVVAFDINTELLELLEQQLVSYSSRIWTFAGDVANRDDVVRLRKFVTDLLGKIDILVNNAGIARYEPFLETTEQTLLDTFQVNVKGTYLCSQVFGELMVSQRKGCIISMSSINGMMGESGMGLYNASKAAVQLLTRTMANEFAPYGIRCNSICPGYILTDLSYEAGVDDEFINEYVNKIPLGRLGNPQDIAYAAAFLASDRASYITGTELVVDGGQIGVV